MCDGATNFNLAVRSNDLREVSQTISQVDQSRLKYLATLFRRASGSAGTSRQFTILIYAALIGLDTLSHEKLARLKPDLSALLDLLMKTLDPGENN